MDLFYINLNILFAETFDDTSEVNELCKYLGKPSRYPLDFENEEKNNNA